MVNKTLPTLTETAIAADDSLFLTRRNGETSDEKITGANFKSYVLTTPTITGATIDNSVIGGSTPAAGTFTTLSLTNDLALADGGTGASLADPNDDRIMFWDDSAGAVTWLDISTGLAISTTNLSIDISNMTAMGAFPDATTDYIPIYDASAGTNLKITPSNFFKNIFGLTADATPDGAADYVVTYDASGAAAKKVLLDDLPSAGGGGATDIDGLSDAAKNTTDNNLFIAHEGGSVGANDTYNTGIGIGALDALNNTGGDYNTAIGYQALSANTGGGYNTANGVNALLANTTGSWNTANGHAALYSNTTGASNTAIGHAALYSNTTGSPNTAIGVNALRLNTTASYNTAIGYAALYSNTTGEVNTANGHDALRSNTTGAANTANGFAALSSNTTGFRNTANGYAALYSNTTGTHNTANGHAAGQFIANGSTANATGNNSVFLGANTKANADGETNQIVIGYDATGAGSNSVVLGNNSITKTVLKGGLDLASYGTGTNTGTAAYNLGVDSSGNVIEVAAGGGGGGSTALITSGVSANYFTGLAYGRINTASGVAQTANTLYARVLVLPCDYTFDRIGVYVHTISATHNMRLGIYEMNSSGQPGALVLDAGTVSVATTGLKEVTISQALTADKGYYLAWVTDGTPSLASQLGDGGGEYSFFGSSDVTASAPESYTIAHTYGALPDPYGTPTGTTNAGTNPAGIFLRIA